MRAALSLVGRCLVAGRSSPLVSAYSRSLVSRTRLFLLFAFCIPASFVFVFLLRATPTPTRQTGETHIPKRRWKLEAGSWKPEAITLLHDMSEKSLEAQAQRVLKLK